MRKTYVIDTSAILTDPDVILSLQDNTVIIPLSVLKELDRLKTDPEGEKGYKARKAIRLLNEIRVKGDVVEGIETEDGGLIKFVLRGTTILDPMLDHTKTDIDIIAIAKENDAIVISNDVSLCILAATFGVIAESYRAKNVEFNDKRYAPLTIYLDDSSIDEIVRHRMTDVRFEADEEEPLINQGLIVKSFGGTTSILARYSGNGLIKYVDMKGLTKETKDYVEPRNVEQKFALELLMDPKVQLVNLIGIAGGGKTYIALAAACLQTLEMKRYNRIAITKSIVAFGKQDLGFLPGTSNEKMAPHVANMVDHLNILLGGETEMLMSKGSILIEPLAYIRGKSMDDTFLLVDEAQNLSEEDLLTILTRAGSNTKIVLTGDPTQCDNPYLNMYNNGLMRVIKAFENQEIAGTAILFESQRQTLAKLAAQLLGNGHKFWTQE
jgi:PhoH-like ATPase